MTVWGEVFIIIVEFGVPVKLVGLIKICLNEMYSDVWIGKNSRLNLGNACYHSVQNILSSCVLTKKRLKYTKL
jgi:hypothetical protein